MRGFLNVVGVVLLLGGIVTLGYDGFTYTKQEPVAKFGTIQVTEETEKTVRFPRLLGGVSLACGVLVLILARRGKD